MEIEDLLEIMEVDLQALHQEINRVRSISDPRKRVDQIQQLLAADNKLFKKANDHILDYNSTLRELSEDEANEHRPPLQDFTNKIKNLKEKFKKPFTRIRKRIIIDETKRT